MDPKQTALRLATELTEHRRKLDNSADAAERIRDALRESARELADQGSYGKEHAATALAGWTGDTADAFERRSARLNRNMAVTAESCQRAEQIVGQAADTVAASRRATQRLLDEYSTRAARMLETGKNMATQGAPAALTRALADVADRILPHYTTASAAELNKANAELARAATQLKSLTHQVEHDGVAEDRRKPIHIPLPVEPRQRPAHPRKPIDSGDTRKASAILDAARKHLGYRESGDNINKFGPNAAWCSSFVTDVWRKNGVSIPILPETADVYRWGQQHGRAYGADELSQARPGDALLFGTGPDPATSNHIGIVEKVEGNKVTLIEGNSDDQVQRVTHTLSSATFYGGVHP